MKAKDRGYLLSGWSGAADYSSPARLAVIKLKEDLSVEWARYYNRTGTTNDRSAVIRVHGDNYLITASSERENIWRDAWLFEIDNSGKVLWQTAIASPAIEDLSLIQFLPDGSFLAGGWFTHNPDNSGWDAWFGKFTSNGRLLWQKAYGSVNDVFLSSMQPLASGGFLVSASTSRSGGGPATSWIAELDSRAEIQWQKLMGPGSFWDSLSLHPSRNKNEFFLAGSTRIQGQVYGALALMDIKGRLLWQRYYGKGKETYISQIIPTENSSIFLVNAVISKWDSSKGTDQWLFTVDGNGYGACKEVSSIEEWIQEIPQASLVRRHKMTKRARRTLFQPVTQDFILSISNARRVVKERCASLSGQ